MLSFGTESFFFQVVIQKFEVMIYRTIILPVVLYGCETWSLTLREERKLRVFENMVLRRIFGPRRDEVTGEWRRLHNEDSCIGTLKNKIQILSIWKLVLKIKQILYSFRVDSTPPLPAEKFWVHACMGRKAAVCIL